MKRKVIQLAGKTLLVSLPIKWAKRYGVHKGDEIDVDEREKALLISTENPNAVEKKEISLEGSDEFIKRTIGVEYRSGADELMLKFSNPKTIRPIKEEVDQLMGFEIISQGEKFCLVKSVSAGIEQEFDNILRRIFLLMTEMGKDSYDAITKKEFSRLAEIKTSEATNNKLTNFCKRLLNKKGYKNYRHTSHVHTIIWELERIADEYKEICGILENEKQAVSNESVSLLKATNDFFEEFYHLFYKFSQQSADSFTRKSKQLAKSADLLIQKRKGKESAMIHNISNIIKSTHDIAGQYYAMVL